MGHRSKTKSIKAKAPSSSKRVPAHHVAKSYHVPESATEIPKDSVNRRIVFRFDCVDLEADCPWSLAHMSDEEHRLLLLKMRDFEKATVGEIISPSYQAFTCYPDFTQCPTRRHRTGWRNTMNAKAMRWPGSDWAEPNACTVSL